MPLDDHMDGVGDPTRWRATGLTAMLELAWFLT